MTKGTPNTMNRRSILNKPDCFTESSTPGLLLATCSRDGNPVAANEGDNQYEANASLASGTSTLPLDIAPPDFYRTEATRQKWTDPLEVAFPRVMFGSTGIGTWPTVR